MNLKKIRIDRKISQSKLAEMSGVSIRNIQAYEQGQININNASAINIYNLAKALECDYKDLLEL